MKKLLVFAALLVPALLGAQIRTIGGGGGGSTTFPLLGANGTAVAPTYSWTNSTGLGLYRFGADTLGFATAGVFTLRLSSTGSVTTLAGLNGALNLTAGFGSGFGRAVSLRPSNNGNAVFTGLSARGDSSIQFTDRLHSTANGTAAIPSYSWINSTGLGIYRFGADTLGIATGGVASLGIRGGASATIFGGAGNMTILAGTGASRMLMFQTTTSGSAATDALRITNVQQISAQQAGTAAAPAFTDVNLASGMSFPSSDSVGFSASSSSFLKARRDTAIIISRAKFTSSLTDASGTPGTLCYITATREIVENAATSCVVSARRFKTDIVALSLPTATRIVGQLQPRAFTYRDGGRKAIGLIAEEVDSVDSRLATRNTAGQINSVNYEQVSVILLRVVQDQQRVLDSLRAEARPGRAGNPYGLAALALGAAALAGAAAVRRRAA